MDDYLHQAADSSLWPDNIVYDPDNDGILIASLGVHEHWNDSLHKAYTRNLGTGNGIELFKVHEHDNGITGETDPLDIQIYPNPAIDFVKVSNPGKYLINFELTDLKGKILLTGNVKKQSVVKIELTPFENGVYILTLHDSKKQQNLKIVKQ